MLELCPRRRSGAKPAFLNHSRYSPLSWPTSGNGASHPRLWLPVVALILAAQVAHRDRPRALGLQAGNFGVCLRRFGPALIGLALAMLSSGLLLRTLRPIGFEPAHPVFRAVSALGPVPAVSAERLFPHTLRGGAFAKCGEYPDIGALLGGPFPELVSDARRAPRRVRGHLGLSPVQKSLFPGIGPRGHRLPAIFGGAGFGEPSPESGPRLVHL